MTTQIWDEFLPDDDKAIYALAGYGEKGTLGGRPALLVIDVTYGFTGHRREPVHESAKVYPNSCGEAAWDAMKSIRSLIECARRCGVPIFYTAGVKQNVSEQAGRWREKHPRTLQQPADAYDIVDELAPEGSDIVIRKSKPSGFFGTSLVPMLIDKGVDTTVIAGCTTSGCVRATVLDSFSYGFNTVVVPEAVFDRARSSHAMNLFEIGQKYADLLPVEDAQAYLQRVEKPA